MERMHPDSTRSEHDPAPDSASDSQHDAPEDLPLAGTLLPGPDLLAPDTDEIRSVLAARFVERTLSQTEFLAFTRRCVHTGAGPLLLELLETHTAPSEPLWQREVRLWLSGEQAEALRAALRARTEDTALVEALTESIAPLALRHLERGRVFDIELNAAWLWRTRHHFGAADVRALVEEQGTPDDLARRLRGERR